MAQLNGEIIERMLFEEGFEFKQELNPDTLIRSLVIYAGSAEVTLSELWDEGDNWYVDTFSLNLIGEFGGRFVDMSEDPIYDEHSLVARINSAVVNELKTREEALSED